VAPTARGYTALSVGGLGEKGYALDRVWPRYGRGPGDHTVWAADAI